MPNTFRHTPRFTSSGRLLLLPLAILALGCQRDQVAHYRVPREAPAARGTQVPEGMPTQMPGSAESASPAADGGLKWALPQGWSSTKGEGMRYATFKTPIAGKVEGTVVVLPGPSGGELANVNRWRGQIGLGPLEENALAKTRKALKTKAGLLNVYDFTSEKGPKSRMVVGYLSTPDGNTWFIKLAGDLDPVSKAKPAFMALLESLHLD